MYSNLRFNSAKNALAHSILHSPANPIERAEAAFLRQLLSTAAEQGYVTWDDVQQAIENSGALNPELELEMDPESADDFVPSLWRIGNRYIGELSPQQTQELRHLRQLCLSASSGDDTALTKIAELIGLTPQHTA